MPRCTGIDRVAATSGEIPGRARELSVQTRLDFERSCAGPRQPRRNPARWSAGPSLLTLVRLAHAAGKRLDLDTDDEEGEDKQTTCGLQRERHDSDVGAECVLDLGDDDFLRGARHAPESSCLGT